MYVCVHMGAWVCVLCICSSHGQRIEVKCCTPPTQNKQNAGQNGFLFQHPSLCPTSMRALRT